MRIPLLAIGIVFTASCAGKHPRSSGPELPPLPEPVFETRVLAVVPPPSRCEGFAVNRLGTSAVWSAQWNGAIHLFRDPWMGPPTRKINPFWLTEDGGHVAYIDADERFILAGRPWNNEGRIRHVWSSPDGNRFAAHGILGLKEFMILDGQRSEDYDYVSSPIFSADGRSVAWFARSGDRQWVVRDGRSLPDCGPYSPLEPLANNPSKPQIVLPVPAFSADGSSLAYIGIRDRSAFIVVDGVEGERFDAVRQPLWSPRGKRLAYIAVRGKRECVVVDGDPDPWVDSVRSLAFSGDGSTLAYLATRGGRQVLVNERGGELALPYARAESLVLNLTGEHHAYAAGAEDSRSTRGGMENGMLVHDGIAGPRVRVVVYDTIRISPDGRQTAYYLAPGSIVRDHVPGEQYRRIYWPLFTADSRHCVHYAERDGKHYVVVDGKPGPAYDEIHEYSIVLSRDSRKVGFPARSGNQILWAVQELDQ